jgi:predicted RecA/RadA family phage recombinase
MQNKVSNGESFRWTNGTGSAVASGDGVVVNDMLCVAMTDIAALASGELKHSRGEYILPATSADDWEQGDILYWNATTGRLTDTAQALIAGHAGKAKAALAVLAPVILSRTALNAATEDSLTVGAIAGTDSSLGIDGKAGSSGAGGAIALTGGAGDGDAGGAVTATGGAGGVASVGGAVTFTGGAPASGNAVGGAASLVGGRGSGNAAGGAAAVTGGAGGATTSTGAGGAVTVTGGAGGATSGTGGAVTVAGGAGTAGNANGGALSLLAGAKQGSGTHGVANLGTSNTSAINIGAASVATVIAGPITGSIGASTAAAGSTYADAGALPAATASVYPTTAADDATGVIVHANDKVTGRMLFIGNGVANKILKVYGPSGATINGGNANAAFSSVSGKGAIMVCLSSGANTWLAW